MNRPGDVGFLIMRSTSAGAAPLAANHLSGRGLPLDTANSEAARHWLVCHSGWRPVVIAEPPAIRSPIHRLMLSAGGRLVAIGPTRTVYAVPVAHLTSCNVPCRRC